MIRDAVELTRRVLDARDDEQHVRDLLTEGGTRADAQSLDAWVESDRESLWFGAREADGRETVAGPDVDDDAARGGDQPMGLTDVHLDELLADKRTHRRNGTSPHRARRAAAHVPSRP